MQLTTRLTMGLLSSCSCLTLGWLSPATAQCVQSHTGVQLHISQQSASQTSNYRASSDNSCRGNSNTSTSTQINLGGSSRQHQEVEQNTRGSRRNDGINRPTVSNGVVVPVEVKTPKNFPY